jgi:hypothetical protein
LTKGDSPCNLPSFSDTVVDKFYQRFIVIFHQQVIDNEVKNSLNTKFDYSSDIKIDLVEQDIPKLSCFDLSDGHDTNTKGKHANLVFHFDTIFMNNIKDMN